MKEFVEKLIGRLEEETYNMEICEEQFDMNSPYFMDVEYKMVKFDDAKTIINELAEEYKDGWIPCSERLPKRNTNVIAQFSSGVVSELLFNEKGLFQGIYEYGPNVIIAWQPLPEPYKPQKTEWKNKVMKHFTNVE